MHGGIAGAVSVVLLRIARQGCDVATSHGDGSTRFERGLLGRLVRARFERRIVHMPVPAQPADRTTSRASDDRVQLGRSRRVCRVEPELALGVAREDAVENDKMIVHVKVDARSAALNEVDGAALRSLDAIALGASPVEREHALDKDARDGREHIGPEGNKPAKLVGHREDVLPQGNVGQDPIDQERGRVCHPPARAARADAAAAARKGDQQVVATGVAVCPREAPAEVAAAEVGTQLLLDVAGQAAFIVRARVGEERLQVATDKIVQDGFLGAAREVRRGEGGHNARAASPATCQNGPVRSHEVARPSGWPGRVQVCPSLSVPASPAGFPEAPSRSAARKGGRAPLGKGDGPCGIAVDHLAVRERQLGGSTVNGTIGLLLLRGLGSAKRRGDGAGAQ